MFDGFGGSRVKHLPLVEFMYNNNYLASIGMTPLEALYDRPCRSHTCWLERDETLIVGLELPQDSQMMVEFVQERLLATQASRRHTQISSIGHQLCL